MNYKFSNQIAVRDVSQLTTKVLWVLIALMSVQMSAVLAQFESGYPIPDLHREFNGEWSSESLENATRLISKARTNGQVTLWVTLDYPFQTTFEQMTKGEIKSQEQAVERELRKLLAPLAKLGHLSFPSGRLRVTGNGCRVLATAQAIEALVSDSRVLHMVEAA